MMWDSREKLGYAAVAGFLLIGAGFIGAQRLRQPAPIVFEAPKEAAQSLEAPKELTPTSIPSGEVVVHVVGAVRKPGIVRLKAGSRVFDAVASAGGALTDANLEAINLASVLIDGSQLRIPSKTEAVVAQHSDAGVAPTVSVPESIYSPEQPTIEEPVYAAAPPSSSSGSSSQKLAAGQKVSLNTAGLAELDKLPGVGPVTAQKILDYRKQHGSFKSIDELLAVKGIGPKKLEDIRPFATL